LEIGVRLAFARRQAISRKRTGKESSAMNGCVLVIDQGTTSTRAIVFGPGGEPVGLAQQEFPQIYPHPGWIEHDPEDLWRTTLATAREAVERARVALGSIVGVGITNQRETTLVWERKTGAPIYNAIVWQDRRTAERCAELAAEGHEPLVRERTGLVLDPYFSAAKIAWILDSVPRARDRAERGELAFGTVDSYLLWRFTEGAVHATDFTNAARTSLFDIRSGRWDDELLALFRVPRAVLPQLRETADDFGVLAPGWLGTALPVLAMAGDQQSALIGQACLRPGMVKATFGTGGFILLNTGERPVRSSHGMLTTIAYQWGGVRRYALEGSIFSVGATVQWLRDGLGVISNSAEAGALAAEADPEQAVYLVPAFAGLGAPHWRSDARAVVVGLTRGATRRELARAALESVGYQTGDLLAAMREDAFAASGQRFDPIVRVDGGMAASDWTMQFVSDILDAPVDRPAVTETTALGVAFLAGWRAGVYPGPEAFAERWRLDRRFTPAMDAPTRAARWAGWRDALARALLEPAAPPTASRPADSAGL
jgi:glycerol kinase